MSSDLPKIFCIGFNKTGTTSIHNFFFHNQLKSYHNKKWTHQTHDQSQHASLKKLISHYQVFSDGERANLDILKQLFPNSKYILNTRNLREWIESRIRWVYRNGILTQPRPNDLLSQEYLPDRKNCIKRWIEQRNQYYSYIYSYFKDYPRYLLILNVSADPKWQNKIINFLKNDIKLQPINLLQSHINVSRPIVNNDFLNERYQEVKECLVELGIPQTQWDHDLVVNIL